MPSHGGPASSRKRKKKKKVCVEGEYDNNDSYSLNPSSVARLCSKRFLCLAHLASQQSDEGLLLPHFRDEQTEPR